MMTASNSSRQAAAAAAAAAAVEEEDRRQQDDPYSLSNLIAREHWDAVRLFLSNPNVDETRARILSCRYGPAAYYDDAENNSAWNNALHYACKYYPPWDVIKAIDLLHPQYVTEVDAVGRTVLHVATKNGVSPQVIRYLCATNPSAACAQDVLGRTPLHYVCKHYAKRYSESKCENIPLLDSMRDVARTICRTAPKSVNLEDTDGCCALEYAIECDAPFKVIRDIQKACEKDWKKRRLQLEIMKLTESSMSLASNGSNTPPITSEHGDLEDDSTAKKGDGLPTASGQLAQVAMLSARKERTPKPAGAPRAMCA